MRVLVGGIRLHLITVLEIYYNITAMNLIENIYRYFHNLSEYPIYQHSLDHIIAPRINTSVEMV